MKKIILMIGICILVLGMSSCFALTTEETNVLKANLKEALYQNLRVFSAHSSLSDLQIRNFTNTYFDTVIFINSDFINACNTYKNYIYYSYGSSGNVTYAGVTVTMPVTYLHFTNSNVCVGSKNETNKSFSIKTINGSNFPTFDIKYIFQYFPNLYSSVSPVFEQHLGRFNIDYGRGSFFNCNIYTDTTATIVAYEPTYVLPVTPPYKEPQFIDIAEVYNEQSNFNLNPILFDWGDLDQTIRIYLQTYDLNDNFISEKYYATGWSRPESRL